MLKPETTQRLLTLLLDFVAFNVAFFLYYFFRQSVPFAAFTEQAPMIFLPMLTIVVYWLLIFWLFGLYRDWRFSSRYEEAVTVIKALSFGTLLLFILIFADDVSEPPELANAPSRSSRFGAALYWAALCATVPVGRLVQRSYQRRLLVHSGIGRRRAVIIGTGSRAASLAADIAAHPALGLDIVGFIKECKSAPVLASLHTLGELDDLETIFAKHHVSEVIIAAQSSRHEELLRIIGCCEGKNVGIKILPDMYDILSGAARTTQIYGTPLIELSPPLLSPFAENVKRLFDICFSLAVLILFSPVLLLLALIVWIDTKASPIYTQTRVGRHGRHFTIYKFRSMHKDAENGVPLLTQKDDARITPFGKFLRKYRLDELPQFWNVLIGDMSVVGPRPERPYFVEQLKAIAPHYARLHRVRPGVTSWGQVKFGYASSIEEMLERMKYDLFYIENMSLMMDFKILLATIYVIFAGRGR
ncbi:MAG: sugar transferase [Chloroherpetonaceae bacterium]|nr:sugar transferase [Chloroherpetonaceae bacterium]MCS7210194.1 sugar transferase [Chloroherpetonaceae bacterium]MDW8020656.1 sugar transferase [Chloroherpetonaceae bacterium]MDW8466568.1 sugar transferase [Chloroherpetonaceae bacterium]